MVLHFVGFKGEEYHSAVAVFGLPDFIHRYPDRRMFGDWHWDDVVVFANGEERNILRRLNKPSFNDSMHF